MHIEKYAHWHKTTCMPEAREKYIKKSVDILKQVSFSYTTDKK